MKKFLSTRLALKFLCVALSMVLISCVGASFLQTDFGKVQISKFKIPSDNGTWIEGNLFRPVSANAEHKVPLVITSHGFLNNKEMQDSTAIELSRRGIAVIAMDFLWHGGSSSPDMPFFPTIMSENNGMIPLVEYASSSLDYVDSTKIGISGHSMGGMITWSTLQYYGQLYLAELEAAKDPSSEDGAVITVSEQAKADASNKVASAFIISQVEQSTDETFQNIHANVGINVGKYDEGGSGFAKGNADLSGDAPESLAAINSVMPENQKINAVEIGKYYGNAADQTLRVVYNPAEIHPWQHFSVASTGYLADFFTKAFQINNPLSAGNQLWLWKEIFNFIGLLGSFLFIVPFAVLLLKLPCFNSLIQPTPAKLPEPKTRKSKILFWGSWIMSWVISAISYLPISRWSIIAGQNILQPRSLFPQTAMNFILIWAIFNGLVGLLLFWLTTRLSGKNYNEHSESWGIKTNLKELLKTFALAVCIFTGFYALVAFADYFFQTDFRLWVLAIKVFTPNQLLIGLRYMLFFFIFYVAQSIAVNSTTPVEGQKEWRDLLISGTGGVLGILVLIGVQYGTLFSTGVTFWQNQDWLRILVLFPLVFQLFIAAYISRYLFKCTGKIWLGAMVNCMIIVMMGAANTFTF
ncbi:MULTISPECIES: alpha/beta fold hydrolase [Paenibacillus]|uniref:AB hydrolase-1 domain-containing protein n=1 Tax=Paenibacillus odorifer TaxID=189426 RepID=A0A1R0X434_9BACL|nr:MULTISPECIES: alpha/beta fold hydrolase [Paenibacillus]ETT67646.1 membrane-spanning protein [Paenibacillus sp. FSL H8-237]OMD28092.1 hypothetical protein BJP51_03035 [Paenibacillus odorifer]OME52263.1 hypothetical protein BSK66_21795 [Paenibacillus odorifer]OME60671.1 hypothetical protein BSK61_04895 [Paenibacillus odorifer]